MHQLRAENLRLEEHVSSLLQRRDHLLAVNARLAIPLTGQPATPQSSHPHTGFHIFTCYYCCRFYNNNNILVI